MLKRFFKDESGQGMVDYSSKELEKATKNTTP